MKTRLIALAFLLLLIGGCTVKEPGAPSPSSGCPPSAPIWTGTCCRDATGCMSYSMAKTLLLWEDWKTLAILMIFIGFLLMSVVYMVAYAFDYKNVQIFVKNEIVQLAASAFILANVLFFAYLIDTTAQQYGAQILALQAGSSVPVVQNAQGEWEVQGFGNALNVSRELYEDGQWTGRWETVEVHTGESFSCPSPCHIYLARSYLGMEYEKVYRMARTTIQLYSILTSIDYVRIGGHMNLFGVVQIAGGLMPYTGQSIIYTSLGTCFDLMTKTMVALKFQEMSLLYVQNGIFPILLISGIIMRSVWFLRKLGGLLIAIAIGVYTLLPLLYVLCWYTVDTGTVMLDVSTDMLPMGEARPSVLVWKTNNLGSEFKPEEILFTSYDSNNNVKTRGLLDTTSALLVPALAIPLLNVLVTVAFIRALSVSLGGDMELAGLTKLI